MTLPAAEQMRLLKARADRIIPEEDLRDRLEGAAASGRPLRVKLGIDPTSPDLHIGHAVPLRTLRLFQELGHVAVLIIGDVTAQVGDPSGQSKVRPRLSEEQVRRNAATYVEQARRILLERSLEIRWNSEWLANLGSLGILDLARRATVAQMLERDDFAGRFREGRPIAVVELLYPLMQGYDSVAVEADVELGGSDQTFNLMVGRDLQREAGQQPQVCMTYPILEGLDGVEKMSKSLGNYVGISEPPEEMFGKLMRVGDTLIGTYLRLATDLSPEEVAGIEQEVVDGGPAAAQAKRRLAREVVSLYWDREAAAAAERRFDVAHVEREIPDDIPEVRVPEALVDGGRVFVPRLLVDLGLAGSSNEARRLIAQQGVRLNGEVLSDLEMPLENLSGRVLQVGRRRFVRVLPPEV